MVKKGIPALGEAGCWWAQKELNPHRPVRSRESYPLNDRPQNQKPSHRRSPYWRSIAGAVEHLVTAKTKKPRTWRGWMLVLVTCLLIAVLG